MISYNVRTHDWLSPTETSRVSSHCSQQWEFPSLSCITVGFATNECLDINTLVSAHTCSTYCINIYFDFVEHGYAYTVATMYRLWLPSITVQHIEILLEVAYFEIIKSKWLFPEIVAELKKLRTMRDANGEGWLYNLFQSIRALHSKKSTRFIYVDLCYFRLFSGGYFTVILNSSLERNNTAQNHA